MMGNTMMFQQPRQMNRGTPNVQQFQQWLPQINDNMLNQLVAQARQQGIEEQDIQAGLQMIANLRQSR